jgi:hypothetical protein
LNLRVGDKTACILGKSKISLIRKNARRVADLAVDEERFDFSWRGQARRWSHDDDVMTTSAESAGAKLFLEVMSIDVYLVSEPVVL